MGSWDGPPGYTGKAHHVSGHSATRPHARPRTPVPAPTSKERQRHGEADRGRAVRGHPRTGRGATALRRRGRQPEPGGGRHPPELRDRLDPGPARGDRRLRRRGGSAAHRLPRGLRRLLWPRQSAPHQRPVRRPPLHGPGPRAGLPHPVQRDRHHLLPGDPPRPAVHRVQPLQRADLQHPADAEGAADRDPARHRAERRRGRSGGRASLERGGSAGTKKTPPASSARATPSRT